MPARFRVPARSAALVLALACGVRGQESFAVDPLRADLEALTSSEMAGREPGTPGGKRAEEYLAARFAAIGLTAPAGAPGHLQAFEVDDPRPARVDPDRTRLRAGADGTGITGEVGADLVPFGFSAEGRARGRLVFAGHGLVVPDLERDDYEGLDVQGAVVLVLRGAPGWREADSPFREHWRELRFGTKIARATAAGAVGFLLVDPSGAAAAEGERALLGRAARARGESSVPAAWISWELAAQLLARLGYDTAAIRTGSGTGPAQPACRVHVELSIGFVERRPARRTANIIGLLEGADPMLRDEIVVIGAHHDHIGRGEFGSLRPGATGQVHPGADDNASGCAALLMVAEHFARAPRPRRSIAFVAFGAEELGLRGSSHLFASELWPADRIAAMVNLTMIGRATAERLRIEGVGTGVGLAGLVAEAGRRTGRKPQTRDGASPRSDHATFLAHRIPALFVHSGLHDEYHTPDDTADRVLVPEAVAVARLAAELLSLLADVDERPAFVEVATDGFRRR